MLSETTFQLDPTKMQNFTIDPNLKVANFWQRHLYEYAQR